jgi:hypothetical protein
VVSEVWKKMSAVLASLRTTNGMWLAPPLSARDSLAM